MPEVILLPLVFRSLFNPIVRAAAFLFVCQLLASELSAAPVIAVADIEFGNVIPGNAAGRVLRICNEGEGTLVFSKPGGGAVIDSYELPFQISTKSIDYLAAVRLGPGECASITVIFLSSDVGSYRSVARIWSNAVAGRDTSVLTARTVAHRPVITGVDFGTRRVAGGTHCSKNPAPHAGENVYLANIGSGDCTIRSLTLGTGSTAFRLDTSDALSLHPGAVVPGQTGTDTNFWPIRVLFVPAEEGPYAGALIVTMTDGTSVTATLEGNAVEAHLSVSDTLTFPTASTKPGGYSRATAVVRSSGSCPLTITGLSVEGETGEYRIISATSLPATLQPGDVLGVELEFNPRAAGPRVGRLLVSGDHSTCDDSIAILTGVGTDAAGVRESAERRASLCTRVHPNPAFDRIVVELPECRQAWLRAELFDVVGRKVEEWEFDRVDGTVSLSLRGLSSGEYFLRLLTQLGVTGATVRVSR